MGSESFRQSSRLLLLLRLHLLKEADEGLGIVARLVHVLQSEIVSLSFEAAREMQIRQRQSQPCSLIAGISDPAADKDERNRCHIHDVAASITAGGVTGSHVGDL